MADCDDSTLCIAFLKLMRYIIFSLFRREANPLGPFPLPKHNRGVSHALRELL